MMLPFRITMTKHTGGYVATFIIYKREDRDTTYRERR